MECHILNARVIALRMSPHRPVSLTVEHCCLSGRVQHVGSKLLSHLLSVLRLYDTFSDKQALLCFPVISIIKVEPTWFVPLPVLGAWGDRQTDVSGAGRGGGDHSLEKLITEGRSDAPAKKSLGNATTNVEVQISWWVNVSKFFINQWPPQWC